MRTFIKTLLAASLLAGPCCALAHADGGQIRLIEQHGNFLLTVFTSPTPLRAGPIDVSVLIQDVRTNQTVTDAAITVELISPNTTQSPVRAAATTAAATNKLLQAALVELPAAGRWNVRVECANARDEKPIAAAFTMEAAQPLPRWISVWPWFTWPFAVVPIFAIHRMLVARRQTHRVSRNAQTQTHTLATA